MISRRTFLEAAGAVALTGTSAAPAAAAQQPARGVDQARDTLGVGDRHDGQQPAGQRHAEQLRRRTDEGRVAAAALSSSVVIRATKAPSPGSCKQLWGCPQRIRRIATAPAIS